MNEWVPVPGTNDRYRVTSDGRIWSCVTSKEMKPRKHSGGYLTIAMRVGGKYKYELVHRMVAALFVDNPNGYKEVNHKDGNKKNNSASNLEWVTSSENKLHAYKNGFRVVTDKQLAKSRERIISYNSKVRSTKMAVNA